MSYTANQYNYATPESSLLTHESASSLAARYFILADNKLDGTYEVVSGDVGLWGTSVSNANGELPAPLTVFLDVEGPCNAFRLISNSYCYPVAFTVEFYNGEELVYSIKETANGSAYYEYLFSKEVTAPQCKVSITRISAANNIVQLCNLFNSLKGAHNENGVLSLSEASSTSLPTHFLFKDTLYVSINDRDASSILNTIDRTSDTLQAEVTDAWSLTNIHSIMKEPSRRIYGKVYITYTDPMLDSEIHIETSGGAYNSNREQVVDAINHTDNNYFNLYDNSLSNSKPLGNSHSQIGWVSDTLSDSSGMFDKETYLQLSFTSRPLTGLPVYFDNTMGAVPEDFTVSFIKENGDIETRQFLGNSSYAVMITDSTISDVVSIRITITKMSKGGYPAAILEVPISSTILYEGYGDTCRLVMIDLLEELSYRDDVEAMGGMSANEITVVLDNSTKHFYFNNPESPIATKLKRNRKIVPWLGVEMPTGEIEWYTLGTFWSYNWDVPVGKLTATVTGFDTIGLLGVTSFTEHVVQVNKSLGELIEYVLDDAKLMFDFITYSIDPALYDIIIPYAWFDASSHAAALRKISECYPMHIYCNRQGTICAAPQKLHVEDYYDVWSDSTNVIDKSYKSLHTTVPNIVNINVKNITIKDDEELVSEQMVFNVDGAFVRTLNFRHPHLHGLNIHVYIDRDATVNYSCALYSWGARVSFVGTGEVRSIRITGSALDLSNTSTITRRDQDSILANGAVARDISSDFIQELSLAEHILDRIFSLAESDKFDVDVSYRGDISLSINDSIRLLDGIAPNNRYNIKRHQLSWNGALTGSAELNT